MGIQEPFTHNQFVTWMYLNEPYEEERAYIGLSFMWNLPASNPFNYCAWLHDGYYRHHHVHGRSKGFADKQFNICMKRVIARGGGSHVRRVFYSLMVRSPLGWLGWVS